MTSRFSRSRLAWHVLCFGGVKLQCESGRVFAVRLGWGGLYLWGEGGSGGEWLKVRVGEALRVASH